MRIGNDQTLWGTPPVTPGDLNAPTPGGNDTSHETGASTPTVDGGQLLTPTGGQITQGTPDTPTGAANITILSTDCHVRVFHYIVPSSEWDNPDAKATSPEYCMDVIVAGTATGPVGSEVFIEPANEGMEAFVSGGGVDMFACVGCEAEVCQEPKHPPMYITTGSWSGTIGGGVDWVTNEVRREGDPETTGWTFTADFCINADGGTINKNAPAKVMATLWSPEAGYITTEGTFTCKF